MIKKIFFSLIAVCFIGTLVAQNQTETNAKNALQSYLNIKDDKFKWEIRKKEKFRDITAYSVKLTSQQWREHTWIHQLMIYVPESVEQDGALLFITGGSVKDGEPNWRKPDERAEGFADMAHKNKAIVALLYHTPNQPLYGDLTEDQLISYTLHNFKNDKDYTWPLLFPMVKGAIKGMDAIQEFSSQKLNKEITRFTVSGGSKRGWTTWLTGAHDKRVEAIAPMVIDVLNMPVSLDYHVKAWNEYSIQIEDYTKLEIPQQVRTPDGDAIAQMVDPYSYRSKLTMPKMIFIGTNDEYWPVDAIKHYIDEIPGKNAIHYVPNAGHDLGDGIQALTALNAFWGNTLMKNQYNLFAYETNQANNQVELNLKAGTDKLVNAYVWSCTSDDRDFRDNEFSSEEIGIDKQNVKATVAFPKSGFKAFYIDLEYKSPTGGTYVQSTRMFVADQNEILKD